MIILFNMYGFYKIIYIMFEMNNSWIEFWGYNLQRGLFFLMCGGF